MQQSNRRLIQSEFRSNFCPAKRLSFSCQHGTHILISPCSFNIFIHILVWCSFVCEGGAVSMTLAILYCLFPWYYAWDPFLL